MNIAFSTDWFLTIPGMLITCGVILLLIALIMFIVSLSKGKKKGKVNNVEVPTSVQPQPVVNEQPVVTPVENVEPATFVNDVAVAEPMGPIEEVNNTTPIIPEVPASDTNVVVEPVIPTIDSMIPEEPVASEVAPVVDNVIPTIEIPVVEPVAPVEVQEQQPVEPVQPVIPEIAPIPEVVPTEIIPEVEEVVLETPEATNLEATSVNIYGGAVPTVEVKPQEENRVIYGGADPLEATQNLPKVDVHHEPYSGGNTPVEPVIPVVPEVTPIPEVAPVVVETPTVVNEQPQQPVIPTPSVIEIPDVEQL